MQTTEIYGCLIAGKRHTVTITVVSNRLFNEQKPASPQASQNYGIDAPLAPDTVPAAVSPFFVFA